MRPTLYLSKLVHLVVGLTEIVLVLRIVFRLFSANPTASFVHWIYSTSSTLLEPFRGVFTNGVVGKSHVLDFTALFALIAYALAGTVVMYVAMYLEKGLTPKASKK